MAVDTATQRSRVRFWEHDATLAVQVDGLTIADVLGLSVREALERFDIPAAVSTTIAPGAAAGSGAASAREQAAVAPGSVPRPGNHVLVVFGATGDLARRKLLPGLFPGGVEGVRTIYEAVEDLRHTTRHQLARLRTSVPTIGHGS
jgi:hypothetical protein